MQYVPPVLRSDDFVVEHLTDVPDHLRLLETFNSYGKASGLEIYLKELALRDENYRSKQRAVSKIGAYAFVNFIRPLALQASTIIGAKWLCLYALPETRLIEYYGELGFARLDKERETFVYSHVKPEYDQGCIFMYQSICNG